MGNDAWNVSARNLFVNLSFCFLVSDLFGLRSLSFLGAFMFHSFLPQIWLLLHVVSLPLFVFCSLLSICCLYDGALVTIFVTKPKFSSFVFFPFCN